MHRVLRFAVMISLFLISLGCGGGGGSTSTQGPSDLEWLVSSSGNAKVLRYNADTGEYIGPFVQSGNLKSPNGIAVLPDGRVALGDFETRQILIYTSGGFLQTTLGPLEGRPYGMVATDDGFLVSEFDSAPNGRVLRWTARDGLTTFIEGGALDGPDGLVIRDGVLYVASQRSKAILMYRADNGTYLGVFASGDPLGAGDTAGPSGLAFGFVGNLFVTQHDTDATTTKGGNVLEYRSNGVFVRELVAPSFDALSGPIGVGYHSTVNRNSTLPDYLAVASAATNEVRIYNQGGIYLRSLATTDDLSGPIYLAMRKSP